MGMTADEALTRWQSDLARYRLTDEGDRIGRRIIRNHEGLLRHYHGLAHVAFLFGEIEAHGDLIREPERLVFTAWFHDAIYLSWRKDNEERSALWAERALESMGASAGLRQRTSALIRQTANHAAGGADGDDALFLDMDCAILGAAPDIYARYAANVRREYFWAPTSLYRKGRSAFLKAQLDRSRIFLTDLYEARFAEQARENLHHELVQLQS